MVYTNIYYVILQLSLYKEYKLYQQCVFEWFMKILRSLPGPPVLQRMDWNCRNPDDAHSARLPHARYHRVTTCPVKNLSQLASCRLPTNQTEPMAILQYQDSSSYFDTRS